MSKIGYLATLGALCIGVEASAQNYFLGGQLMDQSALNSAGMISLSQFNHGFTTARASAMGGAFTSLGADLSSISINPAGLGMYRSSEWGLTPTVTWNQIENNAPVAGRDNNRTRFVLNNVGVAINLFQSTGTITSITLGFGYNKLADFNYQAPAGFNYEPQGGYAAPSLAYVFQQQLNGYGDPNGGFRAGDLNRDNRPFTRFDPYYWGAILGYKTFLLDPVNSSENDRFYNTPSLDPGAGVESIANMVSKGSVGQYNISAGMNIDNILYLGLSIGIQDIYMDKVLQYDENYFNNGSGDNMLQGMRYDQRVNYSGVGVNFKFGAIVRPVAGLRIGATIETPTFASVDGQYSAWMGTLFNDHNDQSVDTDDEVINVFTYKYNTPTRLTLGASYTFGLWGVLAFDYERAWYNGMHVRNSGAWADNIDASFKESAQAANNLRAGMEIKPIPTLALRMGYAYYDSPIKKTDLVYDSPICYKTQNMSAGIGYRYRNLSLDFAYVFMKSDYTDYDFFYYEGNDAAGTPVNITTASVSQQLKSHNFILSLGIRF